MLVKAILVAVFTGIMAFDNSGFQMWRRPLPISLVIGIILGDVTTAIAIGATLELTWLGLANVGGSSPADMIMGSAVGVTLGVMSGGGIATGIALAIPVSALAVQLGTLTTTFGLFMIHWADKAAEEGDFEKLEKPYFLQIILTCLIYTVLSFLAIYLGAGIVERILAAIPASLIAGMSTAGGALPAVGLSILLTMMLKESKLIIFLLLGFVLAAYLRLPMLAIAFMGVVFAGIWDYITTSNKAKAAAVAMSTQTSSEEVDL